MSAERVFELARHLTERDREIALVLCEQQLLTTDQLQLLFFSSRRRAQDRLLFLYRHRVLDRFYPPRPFGAGKPQAHWLLDEAGAILVAAMLGLERKQLGWRRRDDWASHPQLAHRLEANRFVTDLIAATLDEPMLGLSAWYSSRDAGALLGNQQTGDLRPDAAFLLHTPTGAVDCFLEWDRGTETQARLAEKLYGYRLAEGRLRAREPRNILLVVPGAGRVQTLRRADAEFAPRREHHRRVEGLVKLDGRWPLLAATVGDLRRAGPLGRVWQRIDAANEQRLALTELPVRSDLAPADPELTLGRRWRHDNAGFWTRLSPLSCQPGFAGGGRSLVAETEGAQPSAASVPETVAEGSSTDAPDLAHDEAAEAFVARLRAGREALVAEARRDLATAGIGRRRPDLRLSGADGLMLDPEDVLEEERWR